MSKKRKTRKQKEKLAQRRLKQFKEFSKRLEKEKIQSSVQASQIIPSSIKPSLKSEKASSYEFDKNISYDIRLSLILCLLFIIILFLLYYFEAKFQFLFPISERLMSFLMK